MYSLSVRSPGDKLDLGLMSDVGVGVGERQSCKTEALTCGIRCYYLWADSIRNEMNGRTPSWGQRKARWCGQLPHIHLGIGCRILMTQNVPSVTRAISCETFVGWLKVSEQVNPPGKLNDQIKVKQVYLNMEPGEPRSAYSLYLFSYFFTCENKNKTQWVTKKKRAHFCLPFSVQSFLCGMQPPCPHWELEQGWSLVRS